MSGYTIHSNGIREGEGGKSGEVGNEITRKPLIEANKNHFFRVRVGLETANGLGVSATFLETDFF